jgi:hypothetical protein
MALGLAPKAALLASAFLFFFFAAQASAVAVGCGDTITADTKLHSDLVDCPGDGVVVGADGITLDLNGHAIDGATSGAGVQLSGHTGVTIEDGAIQQFGVGVNLFGSDGNDLNDLVISGNAAAVFLTESSNNTIRSSMLVGNQSGIDGGGLHAATSGNVIEKNTISTTSSTAINMGRNTSDVTVVRNRIWVAPGALGIDFGRSSGRIARNRIGGGGVGILVELGGATTITKNRVAGAQIDGISLIAAAARVIANVAVANGDDGIDVVDGSATTLARNRTDGNGDLGIEVLSGAIDGGGNSASGNGNPLQCVGVVCK